MSRAKKPVAKPAEVKPVDPIKYIERAEFIHPENNHIDLMGDGSLSISPYAGSLTLNRPLARALAGLLLRYADGGTIRA